MSDALTELPGLKEDELRELASCAQCKKPIGHAGIPFFWKITAEQYGVDMRSVKRQDGLTAFFGGNAFFAKVMGPNEDLAKRLTGPIVLSLCHKCALDPEAIGIGILALAKTEEEERHGNLETPE